MATSRQRKAVKNTLENIRSDKPKPMGVILQESGYSLAVSTVPSLVTESKGFKELFLQGITDLELVNKHKELLNATRLDHMTFPLGPREELIDEDDGILEDDDEMGAEHTTLTDEEIKEMLQSVNCTVRRIVHGKSARHVYFWAIDNRALKDGLDLAYKIKGTYAAEKKIILDLTPTSDPDLDKIRAEFNEKAKQKIIDKIKGNG